MTYYVGQSPNQLGADFDNRFFYGLHKNSQGELFLAKVDQLSPDDVLEINQPGDPNDNMPDMQEGEDFFEGRDVFHETVHKNLNYEQFRWDQRSLYYYIDNEGQLTVVVNGSHTYDSNISSDNFRL